MTAPSEKLDGRVRAAVARFWKTRSGQAKKQRAKGKADQGARSAVTGGAQMAGFIELFRDLIIESGIEASCVFESAYLELPGYFRPTKEWDLLVVKNNQLIVALEAKSQVGPSFGNNFNNRTEEAIGSAVDLWTAFREGALNKSAAPWLGYMFLLENCPASTRPTGVREPHFEVFPEFKGASYSQRYDLLCRKLVRERHYTCAAFLTSGRTDGMKGQFDEPAEDLRFNQFVRSLATHIQSWIK
jgi:hypothetical protein